MAASNAPESTELDNLSKFVEEKHQRADTGSKAWSTAYHSCVFGAIAFAALAGLLVKLHTPEDQKKRENLVAILAAVAALATTLNASLKFNQKWVANRETRTQLDKVKLALTAPDADPDSIRERVGEIMDRHEANITK